MKLSDVGEFGLISLIKENTINDKSTVCCGIGDDAAVLSPTRDMLQLATADMLMEDVHFSLDTIQPWQLGFKALAVNISDIAAMGGLPRHALVSIALPEHVSVSFVEQVYAGIKDGAAQYAVNIVGGDTISSPCRFVISITVLGETEPDRVIYRRGAQVGDWIVVSGTLGDSAGGLHILRDQLAFKDKERLLQAHLRPEPQVRLGRICSRYHVHALNDISDGLASEINEICTASDRGAVIYREKLPVSRELRALAAQTGQVVSDYALYGGEDYQLVFTADPETIRKIMKINISGSLTVIGEITAPEMGVILIDELGNQEPLLAKGYNHFTGGGQK
jgi:thiamine-monophosphate kinase